MGWKVWDFLAKIDGKNNWPLPTSLMQGAESASLGECMNKSPTLPGKPIKELLKGSISSRSNPSLLPLFESNTKSFVSSMQVPQGRLGSFLSVCVCGREREKSTIVGTYYGNNWAVHTEGFMSTGTWCRTRLRKLSKASNQ
jgi:hypothetical protein